MRILLAGLLSFVAQGAEITSDVSGTTLTLSCEGNPVCVYQMQPGDVPAGVDDSFRHGAHLHPVYSPSGKLVTGNHQPDHPWQRGVWLAWTKTEFGDAHPDFWNMGKDGRITAEVRFTGLQSRSSDAFTSLHDFLNEGERVLSEQWDVKVSRTKWQGVVTNVIDLKSEQKCAGDKPLKLPKYHYGGLGLRGNALWNPVDAVTMLTSEGHDRIKGDSTKAKWVYLGGKVDGTDTGTAVLIHPANFRFPQPLRLNPKNPQLCVAPSQDGDWSIDPGKPYVSRYRLLVFDGKPDAAWIEAAWKNWSESK